MATKTNGKAVDNDFEVINPKVRKEIVTHNGVILELQKVSRLAVVEAGRRVKDPKPPMVYIEDKGREEENPNDPDYLAAMQNIQYERGLATITLMLALGVKIKALPADIEGPDGDEWLEVLEASDIIVPKDNKRLRFCAWLKYIALPDDDLNVAIQAIMRYSGLTLEEDVAVAQDNFRDQKIGDDATQLSLAVQD